MKKEKENIDILDLSNLKGIGSSKIKAFNKLKITNIIQLLETYPKDYDDRSTLNKINDLVDNSSVQILARCISSVDNKYIKRNLNIQNVLLKFENINIKATWFNSPYVKDQLKIGEDYIFFGKVKRDNFGISLQQPEYILLEKYLKNSDPILPLYSLTKGLSQKVYRNIVKLAFKYIKEQNIQIEYTIANRFISKYMLPKKIDAMYQMHFPKNFKWKEKARDILAYEELFKIQLGLLKIKKEKEEEKGISFSKIDYSKLLNKLNFKLTNAQQKALSEIEEDLISKKAMNRLLEGDVGSGKTIISIIASYIAINSNYQVCLMVPTAILASQHLESFKELLPEYSIELLQSSTTKKEKKRIKDGLKSGDIQILIATVAVLSEDVEFLNLGLCITDEQHRFGVAQREKILKKGMGVNTLVMSATPIPRTLGLILYGDLDISIIDELPLGRIPIRTQYTDYSKEKSVELFIEKELKKGRQAYVVCPLICKKEKDAKENNEDDTYFEENIEKEELNSVLSVYENYKERFKNYEVEYLHGKMKASKKDEIMQKFQKGEIQILISTSVIEVGINVPNATIMVVENAERFGLAQLHQLRGRIGRGKFESYCILKLNTLSKIAIKRAMIMKESNNGFEIAEKDLQLRGMGDFFGTMQHGIPEFKVANLFNDAKILKIAQKDAKELIKIDPNLQNPKDFKLSELVDNLFFNIL